MDKTHDLTVKVWGNDYAFRPIDKGVRGRLTVWTKKSIEVGDYVILRNGTGTTRYQVTEVERPPFSDPYDMCFLDVVFAPRVDPAVVIP